MRLIYMYIVHMVEIKGLCSMVLGNDINTANACKIRKFQEKILVIGGLFIE